jgi:transcription initiation factor TFIID subunit 11
MATEGATAILNNQPGQNAEAPSSSMISNAVIDPALMGLGGAGGTINMSAGIGVASQRGTPVPDVSAGLMFPGRALQPPPASARHGIPGPDDEVEGDDEFLPAMADDDYSAQLSWQSQSKDNLKCVFISSG